MAEFHQRLLALGCGGAAEQRLLFDQERAELLTLRGGRGARQRQTEQRLEGGLATPVFGRGSIVVRAASLGVTWPRTTSYVDGSCSPSRMP